MKIEFIGAHGYPLSYASAEDMVRELGPRFVRDGHEFIVHIWATEESKASGTKVDVHNGIKRFFHDTPGGKASGQFLVALKGSFKAAFSDCDIVHYQCLNSAVFCWIPRLKGKRVVVNVNGQIWKDPKWPWGFRHLYFHGSAIVSLLFGTRVITDSYHMSRYYERVYKAELPYIGYGCNSALTRDSAEAKSPDGSDSTSGAHGYYMVMSRVTPHNLTDIIVDGFINSGSQAELLVAGHLPQTQFISGLLERAKGKRVRFLGLVKDQNELNRLLINCKAYLHGHSLGGINSALVRVAGLGVPVVCVDTVFNREVVQNSNGHPKAILFEPNEQSVARAIKELEDDETKYIEQGKALGEHIRKTMSWDVIYEQYRTLYQSVLKTGASRE